MDFSAEEYAAIIGSDQTAFTEEVFAQVSPADVYTPNWHVDCLIEHLQAVEKGELLRLLVMMPPRELKSITISIAWTAWLMGHHPDWRIICASYGDNLAKRHSMDTRLVVESDIYKLAFPDTRLASDQNEKGMFMTTRRGFRKAASVGGQILGDGGDVLIFDDLVKADEALSDTVRETANTWVDQSFLTRANNPGTARIVGVAQRLHMDDPMGHLIEKGGWHTLTLPAEFKRKTIIDMGGKRWVKEEGDLLDETRLTREVLDQKLRDLGPMGYNGQYQQSPVPPDGGDFKPQWLQYYDNRSGQFSAAGMNVYILYDPANSKKRSSGHDPDYTAMMVLALASDNNYYLLDMVRDRLNPTERVQELIKLHKKWNARAGKPPKVVVEQYGMMTDAFYIAKAQKDINYRFPIVQVGGGLKKEERVRRLITPFQEGRIYLPKTLLYTTYSKDTVDLTQAFVEEYDTFPVGRHDDMMDGLSRIMDEEVSATFPKPVDADQTYLRGGQTGEANGRGDWRNW